MFSLFLLWVPRFFAVGLSCCAVSFLGVDWGVACLVPALCGSELCFQVSCSECFSFAASFVLFVFFVLIGSVCLVSAF